jgi:hypothetical protein
MGFLPEQPYFYDYLTVSELLDLGGRLAGMAAAERRARADQADRAGRPRPRPRPAAQEVLEGHAAAGRAGAGADQRPRAGHPRRADERPRSDGPQGGPRPDPRGARRRQDRVLLVAHPVRRRVAVRSRRDLRRRSRSRTSAGRATWSTRPPSTSRSRLALADDATPTRWRRSRPGARRPGAPPASCCWWSRPASTSTRCWPRPTAAGGKVIAVTPRHETLEDLFLRRVAAGGAPARCWDDRVAGPDLGHRAQHVPRGGADQACSTAIVVARPRGQPDGDRARRDVDHQHSRVARDFGSPASRCSAR